MLADTDRQERSVDLDDGNTVTTAEKATPGLESDTALTSDSTAQNYHNPASDSGSNSEDSANSVACEPPAELQLIGCMPIHVHSVIQMVSVSPVWIWFICLNQYMAEIREPGSSTVLESLGALQTLFNGMCWVFLPAIITSVRRAVSPVGGGGLALLAADGTGISNEAAKTLRLARIFNASSASVFYFLGIEAFHKPACRLK